MATSWDFSWPPAGTSTGHQWILSHGHGHGVILGYRLEVDPAALGLPVTAFTRIRPAPGQLAKIAELVTKLVQVSECHRITGEDCFLVKVHAATVPELEEVLDQFLAYGQTITSIVVSTPVPPRLLPLPGEDN